MKNDEYKELKTYEEMSTKEKLEQLDDYEFDQFDNDHKSLYHFMYNLIGIIGASLFSVVFCGIGVLAWFDKDADSTIKILATVFFVAGLFIGYQDTKYIKALKAQTNIYKENKQIVITIQNIGYAFVCLTFITAILMFVIGIINKGDNEAITNFVDACPKIMIGEGIFGVILIYTDAILRVFHKNNEIIKIGTKNKSTDNKE